MRVFIPLQRQPGFRVSGILFLNMLFARYYWVKYGNLVERDHGLPAEGAGTLSYHALDDRHEGGVKPNAMEAVRFGRVVPALLVSTLHLRSAPRAFALRDRRGDPCVLRNADRNR